MNYNELSPYIHIAMHSTLPAHWYIKPRIILDYELIFIEDGDGILQVGEKTYPLQKNDIVFLRPGIVHSFTVRENALAQPHVHFDLCYDELSPEVYVCFSDYEHLPPEDRRLLRPDIVDLDIPPVFSIRNPDYFKAQLFEVIGLFSKQDSFYQFLCKAKMIQLLYLVFSEFDQPQKTGTPSLRLDIQNIKGYIDANAHQPMTLDFLSQYFYMNKFYLENQFKKQFGVSLMHYYYTVRFEKACQLLGEPYQIKQIAEMLGFDSIFSFSRFFKNFCGVSPSEYREKITKNAET